MVSIKDIAKLTGFSVTTVSRALNNHSDVNQHTKEIIQKAARENNYSPNILAKSLVNKNSKTFGFITSNFSATGLMDSVSFKLFMNCVFRANELGYEIVLIHYQATMYSQKTFTQIISERNLEGAIVQGFDEDAPLCAEAAKSSIPTVFIDIEQINESTSYVGSDVKKAAELGLSYLLAKGHESICFIHGTQGSWVTQKWLLEVNNFRKRNTSKIKNFYLLDGGYSLEIAKKSTKEFYTTTDSKKVTAIFAASDVMGIGAMKGLKECGVEVPQDVSLLGYDNILLAEYFTPALTTISQNLEGVARQSIDHLLELKNGQRVGPGILDVTLVERESVGDIS
ncbi:LacI family transcriptional regulator [Enterococcus sp. AZ194]|uniref:LacI family DNA-binding transcriptional regulator n=1 Tax=Enterococcus sp. AZ194 TaxID=2774629 RepID=UPI003F28D0FA